jgi:hypothetical protein
MSDAKFGAFESNPVRFTDTEAWVFQHDDVWQQVNPAEVLNSAAVLTEAQFQKNFPKLPPLPKEAFKEA